MDGRYPERGREYKLFPTRFNFDSLHFRRCFHSLKFVHALVNNNIDCPELLNQMNFVPVTFAIRVLHAVSLPGANTSVGLKSPSLLC